MPFNTVLRKLRKEKELTQAQLAKLTGLTVSAISMYENGNREPNFETLEVLADFFNVDMNFLLDKNQKVAPISSSASNEAAPISSDAVTDKGIASFSYTLIPVGISAGQMEDCEALSLLPKISVPDVIMGPYARDPHIVFMRVNGESMNRVIDNGATIAVMTGLERCQIQNGDIVIARYDGAGYTIKRYYDLPEQHQIILTPDSNDPSYLPIPISYDTPDDLRIFGKVVLYSVIL